MTARWSFQDPQTGETYQFPINPNTQTSLVLNREFKWNVGRHGVSGVRGGRTPLPWSFGGVVRTEAQYKDFVTWVGKDKRIILTTDLDQRLDLRLLTFKPQQEGRAANVHAPWRHKYTMDCLLYQELFYYDVIEG